MSPAFGRCATTTSYDCNYARELIRDARGFAIGPLGRKLLLAAVAHRPIRLDEISGLRSASIASVRSLVSVIFQLSPAEFDDVFSSTREARKNSSFADSTEMRATVNATRIVKADGEIMPF